MTRLPSRILMTADTVGGVWNYALELTRSYGAEGIEVCLATMGALPTEDQRAEAAEIENLRVFESEYKLEWMRDPWADVDAAGRWLLELQDRLRPDLIHLNGYCHGDLQWGAPTVSVGHSCVLSWWRAVHGTPAPAELDEYRRRVRRGLHAADVVVTPTPAMLHSLERHYGDLNDGRVIFNGRDPGHFESAWKEPFVFAAGRLWDEAKNVSVLDRVAEQLSWPVLIAGDVSEPAGASAAKTVVSSERMTGKLSQEEMHTFLAHASIFAAPAKYEPFGLSILEAALSGCALVLGDIPSLRELWDGAALFVEPDNDTALAEAIEMIAKHDWMRGELAWRSGQRALHYSSGRMAATYLDLYRELLTYGSATVSAEVAACV
ncbi:MAG: glycosyltransferase family 4 protein [Pyrinomonadaceae bacterium]